MRNPFLKLLFLLSVTGVWCQDKSSMPVMNICVFDDEPTMSFINCLIEKTDENVVEKTLSSIRELFPGSNLLQMMRYICKANNDEGHVIIDTVSDNLSHLNTCVS
ncbi:uncharacterized protein LOC111261684 isoform X5 [Varroa jacobsoni]|uniref:uncharacterized protein LOC111261684 isoform X5 n=1 Tax=Varroa jacobsoni TaxID=62625 RepID=UPI000BF2FCE8|nr:uncharacterized protein LOC111261684 isoform X5 [Varroa jacobsoni]